MQLSFSKALGLFLGPSLFSLVLDLWSKKAAFDFFEIQPQGLELISSFLYFTRAHNTGVAFGMLQEQNHWLAVVVGLMAIAIPIYALSQKKEGPVFVLAMGWIYGGALGNLYDRWTIGYVRDFIDVRLGSYNYPVFNLADAFICLGVAIMLYHSFFLSPKKEA